MTLNRSRILLFIGETFGRDLARPLEWMSLLMLAGWVQFLISSPAVFRQDRYAAFADMAPSSWAVLIGSIIALQLLGMVPSRVSHHLRFGAMLMGAAMWSIIAWNFWATDSAPIAARTNTMIALVVGTTAVYLGLLGRR